MGIKSNNMSLEWTLLILDICYIIVNMVKERY